MVTYFAGSSISTHSSMAVNSVWLNCQFSLCAISFSGLIFGFIISSNYYLNLKLVFHHFGILQWSEPSKRYRNVPLKFPELQLLEIIAAPLTKMIICLIITTLAMVWFVKCVTLFLFWLNTNRIITIHCRILIPVTCPSCEKDQKDYGCLYGN